MSEAGKGRILSAEHKAKIGQSNGTPLFVTCIISNEIIKYESITESAKVLNISKNTISKYLKNAQL